MRKYNHSPDEKLWATVAHLCMFPVLLLAGFGLPGLGLFITLVIYFFKRKTSLWAASQIMQALAFQSILTVVTFARVLVPASSSTGNPMFTVWYWLDIAIIASLFLSIMGALRCALGYSFSYPLIGSFVKRRLNINEED